MSDSAGHAQVRRGLLLMEQHRFADAAKFFREALTQNPRDAFAFNRLAACQLQLPAEKKQALETITRALDCEPNSASNHAVKAFILSALDRDKEALEAAREAVAIEPDSVFALNAETNAHLALEHWADAEQSARRTLAIDADDSFAANQLAQALRLQNKMAENAEQIVGMLARDPEDAQTHCSAGWAALQRGERRLAEQHFLESLRLDPEMESARRGLLDSFRARSPLYRVYLSYCFQMARLSRRARWGVILGIYFGSRFASVLFTGPMAPIGKAVGLLYLIFVFWVWIAKGVGNFILLFDRFARHALRGNEKVEAIFVGGSVCAAMLFAIGSLNLKNGGIFLVGVSFGASAVPFSLTFTNNSKIGKWLFGSLGFLALLGGLTLVLSSLIPNVIPESIALGICVSGIIGAAITTWIGNIRALRR